jgi:cytochrome b subunit of formate dehydrogenase
MNNVLIRWLLAIFLTIAYFAGATAAHAATGDSDDPKWCRTCHPDQHFAAAQVKRSAHKDQSCRDCHQGYQFNPHEAIEEPSSDDIDAMKARGMKNPVAMAACMDCHDAPTDVPGQFPHGKKNDGKKAGLPYCLDCHGDPHEIALMKSMPPAARRIAMNKRCVNCHGDPKRMAPFKKSADIVAAYEHTMHAIQLDLGSPDAPGCADCHPAHLPGEASVTVAPLAGKCSKCHEGAGPDFRTLASHKPMTAADRPVTFWTLKFFAWLTFLTILALSLHVLLDILNVIRRARNGTHKHRESPIADMDPKLLAQVSDNRVESNGTVLRFDVNQRIAHGLMALSFTTLALTGWPLSSHGVGASHFLVALFGGLRSTGILHRVAAGGLILACLYHLTYLAIAFARGRLHFTMLPTRKDLGDVFANLAWLLGLRQAKPAFARFSYFEKFDYWAVFWGCVIMIGSGLVRWFPSEVMRFAPTWLYEIASVAHTDEALLAGLAIFVWHFYNVHLRPAVFPMSWVFLTGRMSYEEHAEEHGAEHEAWVAAAKAKEAEAEAAAAKASEEP